MLFFSIDVSAEALERGVLRLRVLGGFRGGILRLVQLDGLLTVGFPTVVTAGALLGRGGACSFCNLCLRGVIVLEVFSFRRFCYGKDCCQH